MSLIWSLRRASADDAVAIHAIRSLPETRRHQPMIPGSVEQVAENLRERGRAPLTPDQAGKMQWTIVVDGAPVGWVSVDVTQRAHHLATVGYALNPSFFGRGIVSGALRAVVAIVFDPDGLAIQRLEGVAAIDNTASRRVMERCGFRFEGIARGLLVIDGQRVDHARYAVLAGDRKAACNADDSPAGNGYPSADPPAHHPDPQEPTA